jgi:hypothetical protein
MRGSAKRDDGRGNAHESHDDKNKCLKVGKHNAATPGLDEATPCLACLVTPPQGTRGPEYGCNVLKSHMIYCPLDHHRVPCYHVTFQNSLCDFSKLMIIIM